MAEEWVGPKEAAKRLGMTVQALGHWVKAGAPVRDGERGREFCWPDFPKWRDVQIEKRAKEESKPASLDEAKRRREAAEAEIAELELEEKRGNLVPRTAVIEAWSAMGSRMKARLVNLPAKAAPFVVGVLSQVEAQSTLERFVDEVVTEFREYGRD